MSATSLLRNGASNRLATRFGQMADGRIIDRSAVAIPVREPRPSCSNPSNCDQRALQINNDQNGYPTCGSRNTIPTSVWSARDDGSTAFINDRQPDFGHPPSDWNGGEWFDAVHPEDLPRTLARWSAALRTGQTFHDIHRGMARSGQYERFLVDGVAIRDEEGGIAFWIGSKTAIGDPEVDGVETRRSHPDFGGPIRFKCATDESRCGPIRASKGSAWSALSDARASAGRQMDDSTPGAGSAPCLLPELKSKPTIRKSFLEVVWAAADAALSGSSRCLDSKLLRDSSIKALLQDLSDIDRIPPKLARLYSHSLCVAVLAKIGSGRLVERTCTQRRQIAQLPKWRLARVIQYIDTHMEEPIKLANLANAAGLTRMHFAAQFRAAVGMSPHEYLLRRRISRAQTLLRDPRQRLVDVALSVGFQAQPHFTTVFRRYVGESPHQWRLSQGVNHDEDSSRPFANPEFVMRNLLEESRGA